MPLQILDGSNANIDVNFNSVSYKCIANYWSADINRDFFEATTFCSGGWRARIPGLKQLEGRLDGFASSGFAGSDPLALFTAGGQVGVSFVLTATTGCYFSGTAHARTVHVGFRAALQSEYALNFESTGPVSTFWIVT